MSSVIKNLSLISAMAQNRVIGIDNKLPWRMPADLAHFKAVTMSKPMIMGRKTWESLPGLLPGRPHIVVTRDPAYKAEGAQVAHSLEQAITLAGDVDEVMLVGGANLYQQALPIASVMYLTEVHAEVDGDAYFPDFPADEWQEASREFHAQDERNGFDYSFVRYQRNL